MLKGFFAACKRYLNAQVADTNGDGRMNYEEFLKLMTEHTVSEREKERLTNAVSCPSPSPRMG